MAEQHWFFTTPLKKQHHLEQCNNIHLLFYSVCIYFIVALQWGAVKFQLNLKGNQFFKMIVIYVFIFFNFGVCLPKEKWPEAVSMVTIKADLL